MTKVTADDLTADDLYLFAEGTHGQLAAKLGAHARADGTSFAVWAPNAERVSVIGDFNGWNAESHPLEPVRSSGIWSTHVEGALARPHLQVPHPLASRRLPRRQGRPVRLPRRDAAQDRLDRLGPRLRLGRRRLDGLPRGAERRCRRRCRSTRSTSARGAVGRTAAGSRYRELAPPAGRARARPRLHPRRAAAGHGAPVLRLVGLPDDRLLRADGSATARRRT